MNNYDDVLQVGNTPCKIHASSRLNGLYLCSVVKCDVILRIILGLIAYKLLR